MNRAWNEWYRPDNFPDIWTGIEELATNSMLAIPDAVYEELREQDNELFRWITQRKKFLVHDSNAEIQSIVNKIERAYPGLKNASMPKGKNFADPFVVATAHHFGASVVSNEEPTGTDKSGLKIPDVCRLMNVKHVRFHRIVRDNDWTFRASK